MLGDCLRESSIPHFFLGGDCQTKHPGWVKIQNSWVRKCAPERLGEESWGTVRLLVWETVRGTRLSFVQRPLAWTCRGALSFAARTGKPLSRRNLMNRQLTPTCATLGMDGVNWHWFRHANATLLDSVGTPLSTTQALLGHASPEITREIYLHSVPADARSAVEKVEKAVENAKAESEGQSEIIGPNRTQVLEEAELASPLIQ